MSLPPIGSDDTAIDAGYHTAFTSQRVLFVDDEQRVLNALRRTLRSACPDWAMTFECDPVAALDMLRQEAFDVLVTDMRMPRMDGTELLTHARDAQPGMARIVLSGYSERATALRAVSLAHQFLTKPCSTEVLRRSVSRVCRLRSFLEDDSLVNMIGKLGALPSLPALYEAVTQEVARSDASLTGLARIVSKDVAMTAKILQLVNSSFFGLGKRIHDIEDGVRCLGIDVIRALVASSSIFCVFESEEHEEWEVLWRHSVLTGLIAGRIADIEGAGGRAFSNESMQAGMLHDVGQLVLSSRISQTYRSVRDAARARSVPLNEHETECLGCDHGRVGAYLMGLWGLSDGIVGALAYHHAPRKCQRPKWSPLTTVHVANALVNEQMGVTDPGFDMDYLAAVGCDGRLDLWRAEAEKLFASADALASSGEVFAMGQGL